MSSRKAATAKNGTKTRAKPAPVAPAQATPLAAAAEQLAADIQRALHAGDHEVLSPQTLQALMTAACRLYSAQSEAGSQVLPVGVFELGMWQSWTGR
jgi:hypothetical protein